MDIFPLVKKFVAGLILGAALVGVGTVLAVLAGAETVEVAIIAALMTVGSGVAVVVIVLWAIFFD